MHIKKDVKINDNNKNNILISVIICAHNEEDYINKTLKAIANSDYKNYELIVVCDSCTDKTELISKKYTNKVFSVDFKNTSKVRNFGASKAKGEIFAFVDADTICQANYLNSITKSIEDGFDYGCAKYVSESKTIKGKIVNGAISNFNKLNKIVAGICFVKREYFTKVNGFNDDMLKGEDTEFGNKLKKSKARYIFLKDTYTIPSERKFKKHGYYNYFSNIIFESILYLVNKKKYKKKFKA